MKIPFDNFGELVTCPDLFPRGDVFYDSDEISIIKGKVIFHHVTGEDIPSPFSPEQLKIKFLRNGRIKCKPIVWVDNYEFEDTLRYIGVLHFESSDKKRFLTSSSESDKIIMKMRYGKITGRFTFTRTPHGRFFLKFIDEEDF